MSKDAVKGLNVQIGAETTGLEAALKDIGKHTNAINKELAQVERGLKFDPKNTVLLAQKHELLKEKIGHTKTALDALQQAQARVEAMYKAGEIDHGQYRAFQRELETTKSKLKNFEKQAAETGTGLHGMFDKVKVKIGETADRIKHFHLTAEGVLGTLAKFGKALAVGVAGGAAAATASLALLFKSILANTSELERLSDVSGVTTERIQELQYVGKQIDMGFEELLSAQTKLTRGMYQASTGNEKQIDAFKRLGIAVTDSKGNLRDAKVVMMETINALGGMGNETERDALALAIFGRSAMDLNPLIKTGGQEIARLSEEAHKVGAVMSEETVEALDEFGDSCESLKMSLMATIAEALVPLLPPLKEALTWIREHIGPAINWLSENVLPLVLRAFGDLKKLWEGAWPAISAAITVAKPIIEAVLWAIEKAIWLVVKAIEALQDAWWWFTGQSWKSRRRDLLATNEAAGIYGKNERGENRSYEEWATLSMQHGGIVPGTGPVRITAHGGEPVLPQGNPLRALQLIAQSGVLRGLGAASSSTTTNTSSQIINVTVDASKLPRPDFDSLLASIKAAGRLRGVMA